MPFKIEKHNGKFCVVSEETGTSYGEYRTKAFAAKRQVAISAATDELEKILALADDPDVDEDGTVDITGTAESARNGKSVLHTHEFTLTVFLDEADEVAFQGTTAEDDTHTHAIDTTASNSEQVEYQIETEEASDGHRHRHLIKLELEEPLDVPGDEVDEEEDGVAKDVQESTAQAAPAVFTKKKTFDQSGVVFFKDDIDPDREFKDSTFAFCSKIADSFELSKNEAGFVKDGKDTILRHEVLRSGIFVHPWFGVIDIDAKKLNGLKDNFDKNILGQDIPFNISHQPALGALGWHENLSIEPKKFSVQNPDGSSSDYDGLSLFSDTRLTKFGKQEIVDLGKFRYTSAEIMWAFTDVERFAEGSEEDEDDYALTEDDIIEEEHRQDGESSKSGTDDDGKKRMRKNIFVDVLVGSAATNVPFIPRLSAFAASRSRIDEVYAAVSRQWTSPKERYERLYYELKRRGAIT